MGCKKEKIKSINEIKKEARQALNGRWAIAILVCFIFILITSIVSILIGIKDISALKNSFSYLQSSQAMGLQGSNSQVIINLNTLVNFIIGGPLLFGLSSFFLKLIRNNDVKVEDLFNGFRKFGKTFLLKLVITIFSILWSLVVFVPTTIIGIIICIPAIKNISYENIYGSEFEILENIFAMIIGSLAIVGLIFIIAFIIYSLIIYKYELSYYILVDNEDYDAMTCISQSKKMMKGFKSKLFLLNLSFIGWGILCLMSFGIGFLWLRPYIYTSKAAFYENLKEAYCAVDTDNLELGIE
jgi:uncharacterized membrane protein